MARRLLFVVNPIAGGKMKKKIPRALGDFCSKNNFHCSFLYTKGMSKDKSEIIKIIHKEKPDAMIAVGGDGTVNTAGQLLKGSDIPLGIIPVGSGNGLAKELNIPSKVEDALKVIKDFHFRLIDTLELNGKKCLHVSDFGFNAKIVRKFSESTLRGKLSYLWYGIQEFFMLKPFKFVVETEKERIKGDAFMIAVTNAKKFGTNANINPTGRIDDGVFEISIIKPFPRWKSFKILYRLFNNTIHKSSFNKVIHCKDAVIYNCDKTLFHIDGEPIRTRAKNEVHILPQGLKLLVPKWSF